MRDPTATPWLVVVALLLLPVCVAVFVGAIAFRRMAPLVFWCRRCRRHFYRAAHRSFPEACPLCRARDWNARGG